MDEFAWDQNKCRANIAKHGIDFVHAILVFDGFVLRGTDDRKDVYTMRGGVCRVISARAANRHEREAYFKAVAARAADR